MSTITRDRLLKIQQWRETYGPGSNVVLPAEEAEELARIALASLEAEPVAFIGQRMLEELTDGARSCGRVWPEVTDKLSDENRIPLYTAPPAPVSVPDEVTEEDCPAFVKYDITEVDEAWARGFNACRAAMLQGADGITGKPLTITLPDISSKAFWSGTGKNETFHPETYLRWVKEAIERSCTIARIDVEVK